VNPQRTKKQEERGRPEGKEEEKLTKMGGSTPCRKKGRNKSGRWVQTGVRNLRARKAEWVTQITQNEGGGTAPKKNGNLSSSAGHLQLSRRNRGGQREKEGTQPRAEESTTGRLTNKECRHTGISHWPKKKRKTSKKMWGKKGLKLFVKNNLHREIQAGGTKTQRKKTRRNSQSGKEKPARCKNVRRVGKSRKKT